MIAEPEDQSSRAPSEQLANSTEDQQDMQIEDVSLQEGKPDTESNSNAQGPGVVQSVMGAARSLFGGKGDQVRTRSCDTAHST